MLKIIKKGLSKIVSKKVLHEEFVFNRIFDLRRQIIDDVLEGHINNKIPIKKLRLKASLIQKYSRRLRLLQA